MWQQLPAEFRPMSGRASAAVPYIGHPPVLYFPGLGPTLVGARPKLGRCPFTKACPLVTSEARDTGRYSVVHRPMRKDGAAMRELGESPSNF